MIQSPVVMTVVNCPQVPLVSSHNQVMYHHLQFVTQTPRDKMPDDGIYYINEIIILS